MSRKSKFCIITQQRSGSTWLTRLLADHPQVRMLKGDPFWNRSGEFEDNLPRYCDYRKDNNTSRPWVLFNYLDQLDTFENNNCDVIGYKLMYNHIKHNPEVLIKLLIDKYRIIHLARKNHLDATISRTVGRQQGLYRLNQTSAREKELYGTALKNRSVKPVTLDTSSLIKTFDFHERAYQYAKLFLKIIPLPVLEVPYETLAANKEKTMSSIADFLQVENDPTLFQTDLKKVNTSSYEDKIVNYDQVVQTINNSKYAHLLET